MLLTMLQQPHTTGDGCLHPDAVYYPAQLSANLLPTQFGAGIPWYAYHDAQAFAAGKATDDQHPTQLTAPAFLAACSLPATEGEPLISHLTRAMVQAALTTLDTDTGAKDATGQPVMASYFASASIITLDTDTGAVTVVQTAAQRQGAGA